MKDIIKTMWSKPLRTIFIINGIGCVIAKVIKAAKKTR